MSPREQRLAWYLAGAATASALVLWPGLVLLAAGGAVCWWSATGSETRAPARRPLNVEA